MGKNTKTLYCILGSAILALLNNPIFSNSKLGLFPDGYGRSIVGWLLVYLTHILSSVGFILLGVFSVILIIRNVNFKDNKDL